MIFYHYKPKKINIKNLRYQDDDFSRRVSNLFAVNLPLAALGLVLPRFLTEALDISIFDSKQIDYFAKLTLRMMEERKHSKAVYNDFIEMLLKTESETETIKENFDADGHIVRELSTEECVGSALIFMVGGVDTVS